MIQQSLGLLPAESTALARRDADQVDSESNVKRRDTSATCRKSASDRTIIWSQPFSSSQLAGPFEFVESNFAETDADRDVPAAHSRIGQRTTLNRILDYQLVRVLGRGTIATVYRALHIPTGRVVALKVLHHEHARNPQAMQRFLREMTAITVLDHPHIVRSVDSDVQCTTPYIAMQLLDGLDLRTLSQMYGALSIADCCQLARQAALGLQHVFEHGLVHRDIKPSNLMLSWTCADQRTAVVQIVDFGLVFMPELDSGGTASTAKYRGMGTVNYVAPEQIINGYDVDIRADLYSLGCTIYQLLAGHPPFGGPEYDHPVKTALAHLHDRPVPIAERRGAVPKPLARIVHRLLAKDRRQRFSTPGEVATALEAFVAGSRLEDLLTGPSSRVDSVPINRERFSMYECLRPIAPQDETL